jgi:hypothetical protein
LLGQQPPRSNLPTMVLQTHLAVRIDDQAAASVGCTAISVYANRGAISKSRYRVRTAV